MKVGYVLYETEKKICGINRLIKGCISEFQKSARLDLNILGYDYLNIENCRQFPALYRNSDISDRYNEIKVLVEILGLDLVHSFYFPLPKFTNIKTIITIHDLAALVNINWFSDEKNTMRFYGDYLKEGAINADCILADSKHTKSDIVKYYAIDPEKIKVVYPGLYNSKSITTKDEENGVLQKYKINKDYILSICTVEPRKNLISLIRAFEILRDKRPGYDLKLVLTGRRGWKNAEIYTISAQSRYASDIVFTDYIEDYELDILYKNTLLFVYISYYEGFGLPILEAMSKGTAVLSSMTSSMPEVGGDAVVYCDPYDMDSIVEEMDRLLYDQNLRNEMKDKAISRAGRFSYRKMSEETIKIYEELIEE